MKVAFYAPMKPPTSIRPSGDRTIARLLCQAIRASGTSLSVASRFRSFMAAPNERLALTIQRRAARAIDRLTGKFERNRPDLWFTYHLFHKAPDRLGPELCRRFGIPYVLAEASFAPKRAKGPWAEGHRLVREALEMADHVYFLNREDEPCVLPFLPKSATTSRLPPFLNVPPKSSAAGRNRQRQEIAARFSLDRNAPWLLAVGMMRKGDKAASYRHLANAMILLGRSDAHLLIVGTGEAEDDVRQMLQDTKVSVCFLGELSRPELRRIFGASDVYVWPAVGEAIGMATLEAMAAGLPVVSGTTGAVGDIIEHGTTGLLAETPARLAENIKLLLDNPALRRNLGLNASHYVSIHHSMAAASSQFADDFARIMKRS